jgi:UDP-N-acetylglucosamine 2-epimerase (non-hydrolysing)
MDCGQKIIFPIHPRTEKRSHQFGFYNKLKSSKNIILISSVGYFDMISLMKGCKFIISDSGGIQEESTAVGIKKKVLVVRKTTDRPETVKAGLSELVNPSKLSILRAMKRNLIDQKYDKRSTPYGNGNASQKILKIIN